MDFTGEAFVTDSGLVVEDMGKSLDCNMEEMFYVEFVKCCQVLLQGSYSRF